MNTAESDGPRSSTPGLVAGCAAVGLALSGWACLAPAEFADLRGDGEFNVLLITVDTLRADRIGAYGFEEIETPVIDGLAASGVTFTRAYSPTPLTLPAHTSILTGTFPPFHGVRDNGAFVAPPELDTLAEAFAAHGYDTAAFVGAFVLDSRWGLAQGFDVYFDDFVLPRQQVIGLGAVQRPAEEVIDHSLDWLQLERDRPSFLWVHLYDPHTPYTPPEPFDSRYSGRPYVGEIAYTDSQIGRLLEGLESQGLTDSTLILLASDHGESLGEHGEIEHGFFVYEEAVHVPLIINTPFRALHGIRRDELVSLADITPTLLDMAQVDAPAGVQGRSLVPLLGQAEVPWREIVYSETYYPRLHFGWSELKAVRNERYTFILAPEPELYDLVEDPDEGRDLQASLVSIRDDLRRELEALDAGYKEGVGEAGAVELDDETRERLAALGYLGSLAAVTDEDAASLPNPRDKVGIYNDLLRAKQLKRDGNADESQLVLEYILADDSGVIDAYVTLGTLHSEQERQVDAIAVFEAGLARKPGDLSLVLLLAGENIKLRRFERARTVILDFIDVMPEDPRVFQVLGNTHRYEREHEAAIEYFRRSLELNPESSATHMALAESYEALDSDDLAMDHAERALEISNSIPEANFIRGRLYQKRGALDDAQRAYLAELEVSPRHLRATYNLSIVFREKGLVTREEEFLHRAIEINPDFPLSHLFLARIYLHRSENLEDAARMAERAVQSDLADQDLAFGYFLLADLYNRLGDDGRSLEYARLGNEIRRRLSRRVP